MSREAAGVNGIARRSLAALAALILANLMFNVAMLQAGADARFTSFLGYCDDLFADYFKFVLSYPGAGAVPISSPFGLGALIAGDVAHNPYWGANGLPGGNLTHLHVTPLSTVYSLVNLRLMRWIDPEVLFVAQIATGACYAWSIVRREAPDLRCAVCLFALFAIAYPTLTMLTRGNLFAGFAALCLIDAMLRAMRGRSLVAGALLLGIAINVRPNAIVFAAPLILFHHRRWFAATAWVGVASGALALASLATAHVLYPDYTIAHFLAALRIYYALYAVGGLGLPYGSSLFAGLTLIAGYNPALDRVAAGLGGLLYLGALALYRTGRLDRPTLLFATCATYALASTIFADYHLMVFLVVPMGIMAAREKPHTEAAAEFRRFHAVALATSVLILAPKNYIFKGDVSWQVALNPAILLTAMLWIIITAWRRAADAGLVSTNTLR